MDKPKGQRCPHQCASGCAIYDRRPKECRVYTCSWLDGEGAEQDRPDRCGIFFETFKFGDPSKPEAAFTVLFGLPIDSQKTLTDFTDVLQRAVAPGTAAMLADFRPDAEVPIAVDNDRDLEMAQQVLSLIVSGAPIQMADQTMRASEYGNRVEIARKRKRLRKRRRKAKR